MSQKVTIENWIQKLLDDKIVKPDNVSDFQANLLEGMLDESSEKMQAAFDELSKAGTKVLTSEIKKFKTTFTASEALEKTPLEEEIDEFLQAHGESENGALREQMISKLKSGDKTALIEYIEEELPKKKVSKFKEFIQELSTNDLILKSSQEINPGKPLIPTDEKLNTSQAQPSLEKEVEEAKLSDPVSDEATNENDLLEKIKSISDKKRKVWILYETYEDTSSEYRMKKIKLQEQPCENFISSLKGQNIKVQSYYGDSKRCLRLAEDYLGQKIFDAKDNLSLVKNEAIIALSNGEKACLLFITPDGFFDFQRKADPNALAINYIRTLVDLSQVICIVPDEKFTLNPDNQNPYIDRPNPGYNIEEHKVDPSDKVSILEVPIVPTRKDEIQGFDFTKFVFSSDFTKNLVKAEVKIETEIESTGHKNHESKINLGNIQATDLNDLNYPQLKNALLENWSSFQSLLKKKKDNPRIIEEFLLSMLLKFIPKDKKAEFKADLEFFVDDYIESKKEITEKSDGDYQALVSVVYEDFGKFISENKCAKQEKGFFDGLLFSSDSAETVLHEKCIIHKIDKIKKNLKYNKINFSILEKKLGKSFSLHFTTERSLESELHKMNSEIGLLETTQREEYMNELSKCRNELFKSIFTMTDRLIKESKPTNSLSIHLNFYNVNILRGVKDAENFNITLQPVALVEKFSQEISTPPSVKSFYFLRDISGLVLFADYPTNKSSLYSFNLSNKSDPRCELIMTFTLSLIFQISAPGVF